MNTSLAALIRKTGLRYGIMLGLVTAALFFTFILLNIKTNDWVFSVSGFILTFAFIFLAHLSFKKNNGGTMTLGQGVSISFWIGLLSAVNSIITYIYMKFINTKYLAEYVADVLDAMRIDGEKRGIPDDQIDKALSQVSKFMTAELFLFAGIFFAIFFALLFGLIVSIFTKKEPAVPSFW